MPSGTAPTRSGERGFAMIAVLLVLALIGLLGAEFAYSMRLEARATRNYKDAVTAGYLAEAGLANAVREIAGQGTGTLVAEGEDGLLTFYTRERVALKRLARESVTLGDGQYSYRITDEGARINVNTASPAILDRLLQLMEVDKQERDAIVDAIQDWRDENDEHQANGAESDDYYLKLPVPYRARNGALESIDELLQIKGITPALFHGNGERPGLADLVTVERRVEKVNINTASKLVLSAILGPGNEGNTSRILAERRVEPYKVVPPFATNARLGFESQTFRIDAMGILDGQPRARLTAVIDAGDEMRVLRWSGIR